MCGPSLRDELRRLNQDAAWEGQSLSQAEQQRIVHKSLYDAVSQAKNRADYFAARVVWDLHIAGHRDQAMGIRHARERSVK